MLRVQKAMSLLVSFLLFVCLVPCVAMAQEADIAAGSAALETQDASIAGGAGSSLLEEAYGAYAEVVAEWSDRQVLEQMRGAGQLQGYDWPYTSGHLYGSIQPWNRKNLMYTLVSLDDGQAPFLVVCEPSRGYRIWGIYGFEQSDGGGSLAYETYCDRETVHLCEGKTIRSYYYAPAVVAGAHILETVGNFERFETKNGDRTIGYSVLSRTEANLTNTDYNIWYDGDGSTKASGIPHDMMRMRFEEAFPVDNSIIWRPVASGFDFSPFKGQLSDWAANATVPACKSRKTNIALYAGAAMQSGMADLTVREGWYMDKAIGSFPGTKTLYIDYTVARGLMSGYKHSSGVVVLFGPHDNLSRAQTATILYRLANPDSLATIDLANYEANASGLPDVASKEYYTAAVNWCVREGIITGYKNAQGKYVAFGPNDPVSREQLATMIFRYCTKYAEQPAATADIKSFSDYGLISEFAREGVAYCVANKIVGGYTDGSGRFGPQDSAERCQMAKIIAVTARMLE